MCKSWTQDAGSEWLYQTDGCDNYPSVSSPQTRKMSHYMNFTLVERFTSRELETHAPKWDMATHQLLI